VVLEALHTQRDTRTFEHRIAAVVFTLAEGDEYRLTLRTEDPTHQFYITGVSQRPLDFQAFRIGQRRPFGLQTVSSSRAGTPSHISRQVGSLQVSTRSRAANALGLEVIVDFRQQTSA
jgi:hypothetical protein